MALLGLRAATPSFIGTLFRGRSMIRPLYSRANLRAVHQGRSSSSKGARGCQAR